RPRRSEGARAGGKRPRAQSPTGRAGGAVPAPCRPVLPTWPRIDSGFGRGSMAAVWVPPGQRRPGPYRATPAREVPSQVAPCEVPPMLRILVVDDDPDTNESMACVLRLWGHEAFTARDGAAAVKAADQFRPDVLLLDLDLRSRPDGYEVARQIR